MKNTEVNDFLSKITEILRAALSGSIDISDKKIISKMLNILSILRENSRDTFEEVFRYIDESIEYLEEKYLFYFCDFNVYYDIVKKYFEDIAHKKYVEELR